MNLLDLKHKHKLHFGKKIQQHGVYCVRFSYRNGFIG